MDTGLIWVCVSALIGVFTILTFLAVTMHIMTLIYPVKKVAAVAAGSDDAAIYAAVPRPMHAYTRG